MKCVFDLELTSTLLEDSTHSCKWASCDLSTLAPPSTANHDCPKTVFGKSCVVNCSNAISGTAAFAVLTCSDGALVSDPTLPYPTCEAPRAPLATSCSTALCLDRTALLGPWVKSGAVTCTEEYQAANDISGTLTWGGCGTEVLVGSLFA